MRVGDIVRLRGGKRTARIERLYPDIPGGVRLNRRLGGFWSWNVAELVRVKPCVSH